MVSASRHAASASTVRPAQSSTSARNVSTTPRWRPALGFNASDRSIGAIAASMAPPWNDTE